ncbi:hypothetical protein ACEQ8H_001891 [Pleosporales sp. CAS-2024a]
MAPGIDMHDKNAWDDAFLIESWNAAVDEYKKYHSIHKSGKRLEDALTAEELEALRQYGDPRGTPAHTDRGRDYAEDVADGAAMAAPVEDPDGGGGGDGDTEQPDADDDDGDDGRHQEPRRPQPQHSQPAAAQDPPNAMPQAVLGTVQDDHLRNMLMSWYYAGYYTGLHAGLQQAAAPNAPKQ